MNDKKTGGDRPRDYDAMQREIRERQTRIDDTIGALRHKFARLAPRHLMEQTMNRMHNTSSGGRDYRGQDDRYQNDRHQGSHNQGGRGQSHGWTSSVGDTMRSNPIPLAMIGLGLGWLALSGSGYDRRLARSSAVHNVRDRAGDAARYARETFYSASEGVRDAASSAYDSASEAVSSASESMRGVAGSGRTYSGGSGQETHHRQSMMSMDRMHSATGRFWDMVDDHPLVAGVMGVALGAALGASIPSTRYENRWMGDYADEATHRAKQLAQEAVDRGARAARAAVEAAKEEAGEAASNVTNAAKEEANKPA